MSQQEIKEKITNIIEEIKRLWTEHKDECAKLEKQLRLKLDPLYAECGALNKELYDLVSPILSKPEELEFDGWRDVTSETLPSLTHEQLEFLVWKKIGKCDMTKIGTNRNEYKTTYVRSLDERKTVAEQFLRSHACQRCDVVTHDTESCQQVVTEI
jgi:hypothetical protein